MVEARRAMEVCNACRYCEGFCAVFPAMELRRDFGDGDLNYLANLCHSCRGCYYACQYAPPHEFGINVPRVLAEVRAESYAQYAWPGPLAALYQRNGLVMALAMALGVGRRAAPDDAAAAPQRAFAPQPVVPGSGFYEVVPYGVMVARRVRHVPVLDAGDGHGIRPVLDGHGRPGRGSRARAAAVAGVPGRGHAALPRRRRPRLQRPRRALLHQRRWCHHLMAYGFLLCFRRPRPARHALRPFPRLAGALSVLEPARAARRTGGLRAGDRDRRAVLAEAGGRSRAAGARSCWAPMPGCCCC